MCASVYEVCASICELCASICEVCASICEVCAWIEGCVYAECVEGEIEPTILKSEFIPVATTSSPAVAVSVSTHIYMCVHTQHVYVCVHTHIQMCPYTHISIHAHTLPQAVFVQNVNGRTLFELMNDAKSNFVLFVHTPWCSVCEPLRVMYETVAERFATTKILFTELNADANTFPPLRARGNSREPSRNPAHSSRNPANSSRNPGAKWKFLYHDGYPSIWIFSSESPTPVAYVGDRSVSGLSDFLTASFKEYVLFVHS